jgi:polyisoprenoid-binding protein YceI
MFRSAALASVLAATLAAAAQARVPLVLRAAQQQPVAVPAGIYRLDRTQSVLVAYVRRNGAAPVALHLTRFDATLVYDPARPAEAQAQVTLDPISFTTAGAGADLGAIANWRSATFASTAFQPAGPTRGTLTGTLNFFGLARPLAIALDLTRIVPGPPARLYVHGTAALTMANPAVLGLVRLPLGGTVQFDIAAQFVRS